MPGYAINRCAVSCGVYAVTSYMRIGRRKGNRKEIKIRYRVYLTKFGYFLDDEFETLETALTKAKSTGLECGI